MFMISLPQAVSGTNAFLGALHQELRDQTFDEEMLLQRQIIDSGCSEQRLYRRLERISKAARLFLDHAKPVTLQSLCNPWMHWYESLWLKQFVCSLFKLERELAHRTHLPHATWRAQYEDGLLKLIESRGDHFQRVFNYAQLLPSAQQQIVQSFTSELQAPNALEKSPPQMG